MEEKAREMITKSIKFILVLLIPAILIIFIFADKLLLLFGSSYSENATTLLLTLAIASIPLAFNTIYITLKNIRKEVGAVVMVNGLIALSTLGLSYLLIGKVGLIGVGIGWIFSNVIVAMLIGVRFFLKNFYQ
jgi:O-antigen/teichoic acid export membrane protein